MGSTCFTPVRGRAMRVTKVDGCGRPVYGDGSQVVSTGFVSVAFTANTEEGEEISVTNAAGEVCVRDTPCPTFVGYGIEISFCKVDPAVFALTTGQDTVKNEVLDDIGFRVNSEKKICDTAFALEVWTGVPSVQCETGVTIGDGTYGYLLLPFIQSGVFGDFTVENAEVTFVVQNAATKTGSSWGVGPNDIQYLKNGSASKLGAAITSGDHLHLQVTNKKPPTDHCGAIPLDDPATHTVAATGASAGSPGTYTPSNAVRPANLAALTGKTASPATAWTAGQHVITADGEAASWNGTAWVLGKAIGPATGAFAGTPGYFTPLGATAPANFTAATSSGVVANPATAWTTGQYVQGSTAGASGEMNWSGSAWVTGRHA